MAEARLVEGPNVYRDAVAKRSARQEGASNSMVGGRLQSFGPGDVIEPSSADVADGADFVQQVG